MMIRAIFTGLRVALVCLWGSCISAQLPYGKAGSEYILTTAVLLTLVSAGPPGTAETSGAQVRPDMTVVTSEQALARALAYTGFESLDDFHVTEKSVSAELTTMEYVKLPFLWRQYSNQDIWIVTIKDVRLYDPRMANGQKDDHLRTFTVYIDPKTGHLLRLESTLAGEKEDYNREPAVEVIEEQLKTNERFLQIPDSMPTLSFCKALQYTNTSFYDANEIIAFFATYTTNGWRDTLDVWYIDFRGFPPEKMLSIHHNLLHDVDKGHQRNIIDADTGRLRSAASSPVTIPPELMKKCGKENNRR